jgi:hypothetical protein
MNMENEKGILEHWNGGMMGLDGQKSGRLSSFNYPIFQYSLAQTWFGEVFLWKSQ